MTRKNLDCEISYQKQNFSTMKGNIKETVDKKNKICLSVAMLCNFQIDLYVLLNFKTTPTVLPSQFAKRILLDIAVTKKKVVVPE